MAKRIFGILLLLLFTIITTMWLFWYFKKSTPLKVVVIDKTVLNQDGIEHKSIFWILNNEKFTKTDSSSYNRAIDYYGFFPKENYDYNIKDLHQINDSIKIKNLVRNNDLIYYADTYGIYHNEWYNKKNIGERSNLIYGGLSEQEYLLLKEFKKARKLILSEYNLFALPTSEEIRRKVEAETKIHWTGWTGRYFEKLDTLDNTDLPNWVVRNYKKQNKGKWPFKKGGIVLNHSNETIAILEDDFALTISTPVIHTKPEWASYYEIPRKIQFNFWFDIVEYPNKDHIKSEYRISTTSKGDSILTKHNIPKHFPAVIEQLQPSKFYYFAGDFGDNPINFSSSYFKGIDYVKSLFYKNELYDRRHFFWNYYQPLVSKILVDYKQNKTPIYNKITPPIIVETLEKPNQLTYFINRHKKRFVLFVTFIFVVMGLYFFSNTIITRQLKKIRARKNKAIIGRSKLIANAVKRNQTFNSHLIKLENELLSTAINKQILINTLIEKLDPNNEVANKRLIDYYIKNRFHRFSLEKLKSFQKKIFYDGLTELKEMNIRSCVPVLVKILNKEKDAETIERIDDALLALSPENGLHYILKSNKKLSEWQQLNILTDLERRKESFKIPTSHRFLKKNDTLKVLFCRLVQLRKNMDEVPVVLFLLDYEKTKVRVEAIKTLSLLKVPAHDILTQRFSIDGTRVKIEILKYFMNNPNADYKDFLIQSVTENNFGVRRHAIQALFNLPNFKEIIPELKEIQIPEVDLIILQTPY